MVEHPDSLFIFLAAYEPPAAVLDVGVGVPIQENGAFLALRQQHPDLLSVFYPYPDTNHRRTSTTLGGRVVRWIITAYPRTADNKATRMVVLAQECVHEGEESSGYERDRNLQYLPSSRASLPPTRLPESLCEGHLSASSSPSTFRLTTPSSPADQRSITSCQSHQSWIDEPRFRSIATGIGVVGDVVRTLDWSATSLGPLRTWPSELAHMFGIILHSQSPASIVWGQHKSFLYNTAYISILGPEKHPHALGQPTPIVWPEVWPSLGSSVERAIAGEDSLYEDYQMLIRRPFLGGCEASSSIEEAYFTWTYVPIYMSDGTVGGLFNPVVETTTKARSERRMSGLCQLANRLASARTTLGMLSDTCEVLRLLDEDIPYVAAYTISTSSSSNGSCSSSLLPFASSDTSSAHANGEPSDLAILTLRDTIGLATDTPAAPAELVVLPDQPSVRGAPSNWPFDLRNMVREREVSLHTGVSHLLVNVPLRGSVPHLPTHSAALPIVSGNQLVGCLIVYIGPGQPIDDRLNSFLDLLRRQLSTSASMVASYESEVKKLEEMAALDRAKSWFFTNVSHELRTPLTLILGPLRELLCLKLSTNVREQLCVVERNADRLLHLVNDILSFASAEAGRMTLTFRPTHIGPFTANLASAFQSSAELAGLRYEVDVTHLPSSLVVWVDRDKYEKIMYNLLSNALKYTLTGFVAVSTYLDPTTARFVLEVRDSGIGIPKDELGNIFNKFHRVNSTHGRNIEGTGIGLTFLMELVKLHMGEVTVESEPNRGSVFRVFLPLDKDHLHPDSLVENDAPGGWPKSQTKDMLSLSNADLGDVLTSIDTNTMNADDVIWQPLAFGNRSRARIIIADDNVDMRQYIIGLLAKYCDVLPCVDGAHALAKLRAGPKDFDLVLSDDLMPNMSGPELLDAIRGDPNLQAIPFIIVSANAGDDARMGGLARGADDYLSKPFQARELLLRVHTQLQSACIRNKLELQMAEQLRRLEESRMSFARLCEQLQVGIHRSDPDGNITWANQKWMSVTGPTKAEWQNWGAIIHPDDLPASSGAYFAAIKAQAGFPKPIEVRVRDPTEADMWLDIIYDVQPEFSLDHSGHLTGWVGVWSDVSNLRRLQRSAVEVERAHTQEAERSRELQEQFIDITCHELRNPLNAIYNSAALLGESLARVDAWLSIIREASKAKLAKDFEDIHAEIQEDIEAANTIVLCAKHQKRITDDVLNVSKLSAGLVTLNPSDFSPRQEAKNTVRMFRDEVSARGLQLHFEEDESIRALKVDLVRGDSGRFVQVIVNLLSNAIKFTETAPRHIVRVRIGATQVSDSAEYAWPEMDHDDLLSMCRSDKPLTDASKLRLYVAVADSGLGMTAEEQSRLFQRFAQANPRTYGEFGGSGLGLYVSRMLVELQGGKIHLQSKQNIGSVFRFFIVVERSVADPVLPHTPSGGLSPPMEHTARPVVSTDAANESVIDRLRVLVVEDNAINQRILVKLLAALGCDTRTCNDGQECVDLLQSLAKEKTLSFDLILMDLEMPVLDGLGAAQKIRRLEADGVLGHAVPIVAVSGNARPEWNDRAREAGMDGFVRKPYSKAELATVVETWRRRGNVSL